MKRTTLLHNVAYAQTEQIMKGLKVPTDQRACVFFDVYCKVRQALMDFAQLDSGGLRRLRPSRN